VVQFSWNSTQKITKISRKTEDTWFGSLHGIPANCKMVRRVSTFAFEKEVVVIGTMSRNIILYYSCFDQIRKLSIMVLLTR
jgi:hypothetical protein